MVLFTLALTVVAFKQHFLEEKLATDTADSINIARKSADAADRSATAAISAARATRRLVGATTASAQAAHASVRVSEETAARQLRPYVYITRADPPVQATRTGRAVIRIKNFGQTPATGVTVRRVATFARRPVGDLVMELTDPGEEVIDLAPGGDMILYFPMSEVDPAAYREICEGRTVMLIRVRVEYTYAPNRRDAHEAIMVVSDDTVREGQMGMLGSYERGRGPRQDSQNS